GREAQETAARQVDLTSTHELRAGRANRVVEALAEVPQELLMLRARRPGGRGRDQAVGEQRRGAQAAPPGTAAVCHLLLPGSRAHRPIAVILRNLTGRDTAVRQTN